MAFTLRCLVLTSALCIASAAGTRADEAISNLPQKLLLRFRSGIAVEKVVAEALVPIREYDLDENGLDEADIGTAEAEYRAGLRARAIGARLGHDLNGDFKLSEAEVRRSFIRRWAGKSDPKRDETIDKEVRHVMASDLDGDGFVTISEMAMPKEGAPKLEPYDQLRQLLSLDPSGDGRLTVAELEAITRTTFAKLDTSGNGVLDDAEFEAIRPEIQLASLEANAPPCSLPKSAGDNEVVAINVYRGDAQPTVTVMGQSDVTYLARIVVEPGPRPLYVLLSAQEGVIWKFEGQVDRVNKVVVIPAEVQAPDAVNRGWAGAGVVGVPKDVVSFTPIGACGPSYYEGAQRTAMARQIAKAVGTESVLSFGQNYPQGFSIPSGKPIATQKARDIIVTGNGTYSVVEGGTPELMSGGFTLKAQEDWRATAGGIVELRPEDVVALGKVEAYEVIPGADGLRYLVEKGVLARTESGYRLLQPLPRWPAGLRTLENLTFILPKGMPRPLGSPGHAQVIVEP